VLFETVRYEHLTRTQEKKPGKPEKTFRFRRPVAGQPSLYVPSRGNAALVVFRKDRLAGHADADLHWAEGEDHVLALERLDLLATTTAGGAKGVRAYPVTELQWAARGRHVTLHADADDDGEAYTRFVAKATAPVARSVRVVAYDDFGPGGDVLDFINDGGTKGQLTHRVADAEEWAGDTAREEGARQDVPLTTPPFPLEALPPAVRAFVAAAAESLGVPAEMVGVPLLGFVAALIGSRLHLVLKASYREFLTLYLAIIAPPGSAKTPALNLAKWPLDALQGQAYADYRMQLAEFEEQVAAGKNPKQPELRHYLSTDLTVEALAVMLSDAPGIAVIRDEISAWVASLNQYKGGKGSDRQQYLSLWSSTAWKVDRKGGACIYVAHPVACVVGGIQPDLVGDLQDAAQRRDGFVERILPVVPEVEPALWTEAVPTPEQYRDVLSVFAALDRLLRAGDNLPADAAAHSGTGIHLTREARELWSAWFNENQRLTSEVQGLAAGFFAKLPAHVARFALILHALWNPDDPRPMVSVERMADAIELGEFFRAHIGKFLTLLHAAAPSQSAGLKTRIVRILRIIPDQKETQGWVARSELYRRLRNIPPADLTTALAALQERGQVERRTLSTATKPIEQWRLAPKQQDFTPANYSHFSQYPALDARSTPDPTRPPSYRNEGRPPEDRSREAGSVEGTQNTRMETGSTKPGTPSTQNHSQEHVAVWRIPPLWEVAGRNDQPGDDRWTQ
jgi:hypothetical protein